MMNVSNLLSFKENLNISKDFSIGKKDTSKPVEESFDTFLKQTTEGNKTQHELTDKITERTNSNEERNPKDKLQSQKEISNSVETAQTTKMEKEIEQITPNNNKHNSKSNTKTPLSQSLEINHSETKINLPKKEIDNLKSKTESNELTSTQTQYNLERLYQFLLTFLNLTDKTSIPQDVKDKIENIKSKISNGRLNLSEISTVILELQRLLNRPINDEFKSLQKEIRSLETQEGNSRSSFPKLTLTDISENKNLSQNKNTSFEILINSTRGEVKKDDDKQSRFVENPLQTQIKFDNLKLITTQPQNTSLQSNFFVQLQMLSRAVEEFSGRLVMNLRNGTSEMKMTLFPPDIGKVFVKVETTNDGKLTGNIVVSTKEAYTLFQEHLNTIKENLINQGFNVSNMNLTLDNSMFGSGYRNNKGEIEENFGSFSFNSGNSKEAYDTSVSINRESNYDGRILIYA